MEKPIKPGKREQIISSTLALFGRTHDIKKVSIESIARAAGASPTTIYNLFGTRDNLVFEALKLLIHQSLESYRQTLRSSLPFQQKLTIVLSGKQDMLAQYNTELFNNFLTQYETMRPIIDEIYANEVKPLWVATLKEGKEQGYIDPAVDEEALLLYMDLIKAGFVARQDVLRKLTDQPELLRNLTRFIFFGFLKKDIDLFKEG